MRTIVSHRQRQRGTATFIVLALIVIVGFLVINNSRTLHSIDRRIQLLEKQQIKHWEHAGQRSP